jgi:NifU-like protein involved in Fe-S cluster formation
MHRLPVLIIAFALAGCGVETATTAATGAAIKKQEVEEGRKTMTQVEQKVGRAVDQMEQRAAKDAEKNRQLIMEN